MQAPPERIDLAAGAALRRHGPGDAEAVHAVIEANRDHLRPFMPWADQSAEDTARYVALAPERWAERSEFAYLLVAAEGGEVLGSGGIHRRVGPGAADVGYWLAASATGRGLATAMAAALVEAAFELDDVARVEIHCDEANVRSAAIPRRLGFRLDRVEADRVSAPGDVGRSMIWVRDAPLRSP